MTNKRVVVVMAALPLGGLRRGSLAVIAAMTAAGVRAVACASEINKIKGSTLDRCVIDELPKLPKLKPAVTYGPIRKGRGGKEKRW